jgi:hypothetical protein
MQFIVKRDIKIQNLLLEAITLAALALSLPHYPYQKDERANNFHLFYFCNFSRPSFLHDSDV